MASDAEVAASAVVEGGSLAGAASLLERFLLIKAGPEGLGDNTCTSLRVGQSEPSQTEPLELSEDHRAWFIRIWKRRS